MLGAHHMWQHCEFFSADTSGIDVDINGEANFFVTIETEVSDFDVGDFVIVNRDATCTNNFGGLLLAFCGSMCSSEASFFKCPATVRWCASPCPA